MHWIPRGGASRALVLPRAKTWALQAPSSSVPPYVQRAEAGLPHWIPQKVGGARGRAERLCVAFRMDAGPAGVKETARAPRIAISVVQLGRRDASSRYKKSVVTVRSGGSS